MTVGVLEIALGTASIRTGWTLPWVRRHVARPRIYGLGAVLVGTAGVVLTYDTDTDTEHTT
jgi:hypothetical protein